MKININDKVSAILTSHGESLMKANNPIMFSYNYDQSTKRIDAQLHVVMNTFGHEMYCGAENIFKDNIIVISEGAETKNGTS